MKKKLTVLFIVFALLVPITTKAASSDPWTFDWWISGNSPRDTHQSKKFYLGNEKGGCSHYTAYVINSIGSIQKFRLTNQLFLRDGNDRVVRSNVKVAANGKRSCGGNYGRKGGNHFLSIRRENWHDGSARANGSWAADNSKGTTP